MSRQVIAAVEDIFFKSKIKATAEHLGVHARFVRNEMEALEAVEQTQPALVIVDLHCERLNPFTLAEKLKAGKDTRAAQLLGFFSHVQTALQERAEAAGFDSVLPCSAFTKRLAEILQAKD